MKIAIDTDTDGFEEVVRVIYAAYGYDFDDDAQQSSLAAGVVTLADASVLPGGWTERKLRKWARLLTEDAQEVVRYVAAHPPQVSWDDVAEHLGMVKELPGPVSGNVLGGAMSSGGHALNKFRGAPRSQPIDRDYNQRVYIIDERVAAILADELGAPSA